MSNKLRAPFPWFGGKGAPKLQKAILEVLPPHDCYVEPFGGGASILITKPKSKVEVYNDVNRGVVNFFRVISDPEYFGKFMARVSLLPWSRELYEEFLRTWPTIHDPVEQAVRWYYIAQQAFSGIFGASWRCEKQRNITDKWRSSFFNLPDVHERMQGVQIECCDWRNILKRFSGPGYLAYCDPPYVMGTRISGGYEHELKDSDHSELIAVLLEYDGAVVLSGYDNEIYLPLLDAGWTLKTVEVLCTAGGSKPGPKKPRTECLWLNPEAIRRSKVDI